MFNIQALKNWSFVLRCKHNMLTVQRRPPIYAVAKFIVPDWGDKVDSSIGLSYRTTRLHRLAGRYDKPMPESTLSPHSGTMYLATGSWVECGVPYTAVLHSKRPKARETTQHGSPPGWLEENDPAGRDLTADRCFRGRPIPLSRAQSC
jgi:hypothetical protein